MESLNLISTAVLAFGSGLAAGRYLWPGIRRHRDELVSARAELARLGERLAGLASLAEQRAAAIAALEARLEAALKQASEAGLELARLGEREGALSCRNYGFPGRPFSILA